jgi:hypothetical protein
MTDLQQALNEIVKHLEDEMTYLAAMEAALIENGHLQAGQVAGHLLTERKKLANARHWISALQ